MTSVENLKVAQASGTGIIGDPFAWWGARSAAASIISRFHSGPNHCSVRSKTAVPTRLGSLSRGTLSIQYAAIGGSHGKDRDDPGRRRRSSRSHHGLSSSSARLHDGAHLAPPQFTSYACRVPVPTPSSSHSP